MDKANTNNKSLLNKIRKEKLMTRKEYFMEIGQKNLQTPMCLICNTDLAHKNSDFAV